MGEGGSKIGQKSVMYYLNGPQERKKEISVTLNFFVIFN